MSRKKKDRSVRPDSPHGDHIEFGTDQLRDVLALLKQVLYRRPSRKDCASYHIVAEPGKPTVTISAIDLVNRLQITVKPLARVGSGTVMLDAHAIGMLLDAYPEPRIRVHLGHEKKNEVKLSWIQSDLTVPAYDPEKEMKETAEPCLGRSGYFFRADELANAIRRIKYAVDEQATRYALGGIYLDLPDEGDQATLVGCDGRRLAMVACQVTKLGEPNRLVHPVGEFANYTGGVPVIPLKAMQLVEKLSKRDGAARVAVSVFQGDPIDLEKHTYGPGKVQFVTADAVLTTRPLDGRFPLYRDVIPGGPPAAWAKLPDASRLGSILALANASTSTESKGVEITMAGGCIMMWAESDLNGKSRVSMTEVEMEGKCSFSMDAMFLKQMVAQLGSDPLTIEWFGPKDAIHLVSSHGWEGVIMPLTRDRSDGPANQTEVQAETPEDSRHEKIESPAKDDLESDEDGNVIVVPSEPEPIVPKAIVPETHKANGHASNGHAKGRKKK